MADVTHWNTNGSTSAKWSDLEHWSQDVGTITDSWGICSTTVWIYVGIPEWWSARTAILGTAIYIYIPSEFGDPSVFASDWMQWQDIDHLQFSLFFVNPLIEYKYPFVPNLSLSYNCLITNYCRGFVFYSQYNIYKKQSFLPLTKCIWSYRWDTLTWDGKIFQEVQEGQVQRNGWGQLRKQNEWWKGLYQKQSGV